MIPDGQINPTDDLAAYLRGYVPDVKHGLWLPREQYATIMLRACADPDFPRANPQRRHDDGGV